MHRYEWYVKRGYQAADFAKLSQFERLRGLIKAWKKSEARDKHWQFVALWDESNPDSDWVKIEDWWRRKSWRYWNFGIWTCQNYWHLDIGPCGFLFAV